MNNYIIGLLATDGCTQEYICKDNRKTYYCGIELKDKDVLEKISNHYDIPLIYRQRIIKNKLREFYSIHFKTCQIGNIGELFINNKRNLFEYYLTTTDKNTLIRGIFDGDGSVCNYQNKKTLRVSFVVNSNHQSLINIIEHFCINNNIKYSRYFDKRGVGCYNYSIGSRDNVNKIFTLMYSDKSNLWLERKYNIFINNGFPILETV